MVKRKAFCDVDPNRQRRTRRACASKGSNRSINSSSSVASLADDSEFDFLTNPKREEQLQVKDVVGVNKNDKDGVWNSNTKTPKISNCTVQIKNIKSGELGAAAAAAAATTTTLNTAKNSTSPADSSALSSKLPPARTGTGNSPPSGSSERNVRSKGDQRRRRSKNDKKRHSKEDRTRHSCSSSSLETILEGDEKDDDHNAFAILPRVEPYKSEPGAASSANPDAVTKTSVESTPKFCLVAPSNTKTAAPSVLKSPGPANDETRMTVGKALVHNGNPKEGSQSQLRHAPEDDVEDMDETEDEDFLDLTLSPPAVESSDFSMRHAGPTENALTPKTDSGQTKQPLPSYHAGDSPRSLQPFPRFKQLHQTPDHSASSKQKLPLPRRPKASSSASVSFMLPARNGSEETTDTNSDSKQIPPSTARVQQDATKPSVQVQMPSIITSPDRVLRKSVNTQDIAEVKNQAPENNPMVADGSNKPESSVGVGLKPTAANGLRQQEDPVVTGAPSYSLYQSGDSVDQERESKTDASAQGEEYVVAGTRKTAGASFAHQSIDVVSTERSAAVSHGSSQQETNITCAAISSHQQESAESSEEEGDDVGTTPPVSSHDKIPMTKEEMMSDLKRSHLTRKKSKCLREYQARKTQSNAVNSFKEIGRKSPQVGTGAASHRSRNQRDLSNFQSATAADESISSDKSRSHDAMPAETLPSNDGATVTRRQTNGFMIASTESITRAEPIRRKQHCPAYADRSDPPSGLLNAGCDRQSAKTNANKSLVGNLDVVPASDFADQRSNKICKSALAWAKDPTARRDVDTQNAKSNAVADVVGNVGPCHTSAKLDPSKTANRVSRQSACSNLIPWTAELAGRAERAHGINVEPLFKLPDGRWYRHPLLPPGWTIGVSRSSNIPYYMHPDFGSTFYCPVPLPSSDGKVVGTSLIFHADTPMKVAMQSIQSVAPPPGAHSLPVFGFSVSENIGNKCKSNSVTSSLPVHSNSTTADGASAEVTAPLYSKESLAGKPRAFGKLENNPESACPLDDNAKTQNRQSNYDQSSALSLTDAIQNTTPLGAFAVTAHSTYSSSQNTNDGENTNISNELSFIDDDEQIVCEKALCDGGDIPPVVVVVANSAARNAKTPADDRTEEKTVQRSAEAAGTDILFLKNCEQATGDDNRTAATSLNLSDESDDSAHSSPSSLVWCGSENDSVVLRQARTPTTPSFELAPMHQADVRIRLRQHKSPNCTSPAMPGTLSAIEEREITPFHRFDVGTNGLRCHHSLFQQTTKPPSPTKDSPHGLDGDVTEDIHSGGAVASTTDNLTVQGDSAVPVKEAIGDFPVSANDTTSAKSDSDFPEANSSEQTDGGAVAVTTDDRAFQGASVFSAEESIGHYGGDISISPSSEGSFPATNNSPMSPDKTSYDDGGDDLSLLSLPIKVIFDSEYTDDDISRLDNTPVQVIARSSILSTRSKSTLTLLTDSRCTTMASLFERVCDSVHGASKNRQDVSTVMSHSTASSFSILSRVSHRTLYPKVPICALQNVGALPLAKPKRKKWQMNKRKKRTKYSALK